MSNILIIFTSIVFFVNLIIQIHVKTLSGVFVRAVLSGTLCSLSFQIVNYLHLGHFDPFFYIAVFVQMAMSIIIGVAVGAIYYLRSKKGDRERA